MIIRWFIYIYFYLIFISQKGEGPRKASDEKKRASRTKDIEAKRRKIWAFISRKEIPRVGYHTDIIWLNQWLENKLLQYMYMYSMMLIFSHYNYYTWFELFCLFRPKGKKQQHETQTYRMLKRWDAGCLYNVMFYVLCWQWDYV